MHSLLHYANLQDCETFSTLSWIALNILYADKSTALVNFCLTCALIQEINADFFFFHLLYQPKGRVKANSLFYKNNYFLSCHAELVLLKMIICLVVSKKLLILIKIQILNALIIVPIKGL